MFVVADRICILKIKQLWDLPEGTRARAVFLKNEEQPTLLELIQFDPHSERLIREGTQTWDYAIYDIALSVKDQTRKPIKIKG